jgi:hypothetical protein
MAARLRYLPQAVEESTGYRVLPGVRELLPAVGIASGHYGIAELAAAGADHVLASLEGGLPL